MIKEKMEDKEIIGQQHLLNNGPIGKMLSNKNISSMVLYGQSGIGKTTLANYIIKDLTYTKFTINAVNTPINKIKEILENYGLDNLILLIDEIHRLDKTKQNLLLPYLEKINVIVIGTTTENPYYSFLQPLRSRFLFFELQPPKDEEIYYYLQKKNKNKYPQNILNNQVLKQIINASSGDLRKNIQYFEFLQKNYKNSEINDEVLKVLLQNNHLYQEDEHFNYMSALQKSIRASDVNAALFYTAKLLIMGDYNVLTRRLIVIAYEDIGLANPALFNRISLGIDNFQKIGMPEGRIILANLIVELALSPKSQTAYQSLDKAIDLAKNNLQITIPPNIRQNQPQNNKYNQTTAFYQDNLPLELQGINFLEFNQKSKNEKLYQEQYEKIKKEKNAKK